MVEALMPELPNGSCFMRMSGVLDLPRGAHGAGAQAVGLVIADKLGLEQIELQVALQLFADVGGQADAHGTDT